MIKVFFNKNYQKTLFETEKENNLKNLQICSESHEVHNLYGGVFFIYHYFPFENVRQNM